MNGSICAPSDCHIWAVCSTSPLLPGTHHAPTVACNCRPKAASIMGTSPDSLTPLAITLAAAASNWRRISLRFAPDTSASIAMKCVTLPWASLIGCTSMSAQ